MPLKRNSVSEASRFAPDLKKQAGRFVYLGAQRPSKHGEK
jgi:hypothetical protein